MKEIVQFKVIWYEPGDAMYFVEELDAGLFLDADGKFLKTIEDHVKQHEFPPGELHSNELEATQPLIEFRPIRYLADDEFCGVEYEVENTSAQEVFADYLPAILKLTNGKRPSPSNSYYHEGTNVIYVNTLWDYTFTDDDDGGSSDVDLLGAVNMPRAAEAKLP